MTVAGATAQTAYCPQLQAELSALERSGDQVRGRQYEDAAARQRREFDRTAGYYKSIGCDRGRFLIFGEDPPAQCGPLQGRLQQMQANLNQLLAQADRYTGGPGLEQRRRALLSAIDRECRPGAPARQQPQQSGGFFDTLFGRSDPRPATALPEPGQEIAPPVEVDPDRAVGQGTKLVCVRTCDGYFFPLATGASSAGELCRAQCPGAETQVFSMSNGGDISKATSTGGGRYTDLANASRYLKTFDPTCTCKRVGQTWAQSLKEAEDLLARRKGDIIVTETKAEELSRIKAPDVKAASASDRKKGKAGAIAPALPDASLSTETEAVSGAAAPTASQDSSGIGPQTISDTPTVDQGEGIKRDVTTPQGVRKTVRVVGPGAPANQGPVAP